MDDVKTFEDLQVQLADMLKEKHALKAERDELYQLAERQTRTLCNCYAQLSRANAKNYIVTKRNRMLIKYNRIFASFSLIILILIIIRTLVDVG